ncbi:MAG: hypothetical protein Q4D71_13970, partial [Oscillospiraceae bacterium]|nr:hypothetical protein [Oscillospiraceae bacterium]
MNRKIVSEDTKKFVADVDKVEFSNPDLVWIGKVDKTATLGELKKANGLEVEYSADLTKDQISEINVQTVEAGDWTLISMQPFSSEENLTITMKNGDQFVVKVTDAQISTHVITADGKDYVITVTYGPEAGIPEGSALGAVEISKDSTSYEQYVKETEEVLSKLNGADAKVQFARYFDITIYDAE